MESVSLYKILIEEKKILCTTCNKKLSGVKFYNVKRHYLLVHQMDIEENYKGERKYFTLGRSDFLRCALGLVSVNSLPFKIFDSRFFKDMIQPYERFHRTNLNSRNIVSLLENGAESIKKEIARRLNKRMVSIKIGIASRLDSSLLGVNVQYVEDAKIVIHTLGMIHLPKGHTAADLKEEVVKCLGVYGIELSAVYSNTTDNGANVVETSKLLKEAQEEFPLGETFEDDDDEEERIQSTLSSVLSVVRCAAHTIQLAAYDVLKDLETDIHECRNAVKEIRTAVRNGSLSAPMPVLDNSTRWMSTFDMLNSLLLSKDHVTADTEVNWEFVRHVVNAFQPLAICTKRLQNEQYTIGDFLRDWLTCEYDLEDVAGPYSQSLLDAMKKRRASLLNNEAFLSAIYMDPRFNYANSNILSEEQKFKAISHLVKTLHSIRSIEGLQASGYVSDANEAPGSSNSIYAKLERSLAVLSAGADDNQKSFREKLQTLSNRKRSPLEANVLGFWRAHPDEDMRKVAKVALAVPATQVSVERAFSALSLILTKLRNSLGNKNVNLILLAKLNSDILDSINMDKFESMK